MEFRILGPLEVVDEERQVALPSGKPAALLAVLLLRANEIVPADVLVDQLWGERPPKSAGHLVHVYVSQLRKAFGSHGDVLGDVVPRLRPRCRSGTASISTASSCGCGTRGMRSVPTIRRGPRGWQPRRSPSGGARPLAEFAYESFAQAAIARLEELRLAAVELRLEAELRRGCGGELVARARVARPRPPASRAAVRNADDGPVPLRAPGSGARGLPGSACTSGGEPRARAGPGAPAARTLDSPAGSGLDPARDPGVGSPVSLSGDPAAARSVLV